MLQFQNIEYLLWAGLLVPVVFLFVSVLRWKQKVKNNLGDEELINRLTEDYSPKKFFAKFLIFAAALLLCVIGLANLRSPGKSGEGKKAGIDVMIALDVSNSMLAQDVKPNRMTRARQLLGDIVEKIGDNRLGLVVFAGQAFLQMPLTSDLAAAKMYISNAGPSAVPVQGTVISDALRLCNTSLDTKEKKYKAVILITDGEGHDEKLGEAINELKDNGVIVHTIGIGSPTGATIIDPQNGLVKKDENGEIVITKLNEDDLKQIAEKTDGEYHLFTNSTEVSNSIMAALNGMEKKLLGEGGHRVYTSFFQWFLWLAFGLLVFEIFIPERKINRP